MGAILQTAIPVKNEVFDYSIGRNLSGRTRSTLYCHPHILAAHSAVLLAL